MGSGYILMVMRVMIGWDYKYEKVKVMLEIWGQGK
jgi:hypothetical protein